MASNSTKARVRALITTYERPRSLKKVAKRLSRQFAEIFIFDNSLRRPPASTLERKNVLYVKTGINIGFDKNLAQGVSQARNILTADDNSLDLLCGDDDEYSANIAKVLQKIADFLIDKHGTLPPAIIIGHQDYGRDLPVKTRLHSMLGKSLTVSPSGTYFMNERNLSSLGLRVKTFTEGTLWKIEATELAKELLLKYGLPRYIGIAYRSNYLADFILSRDSNFFQNTMHLYAAPLVLPLFNLELPPIYYFLPNKPLLHYYVGSKDWDSKAVWHALERFFDALVQASPSDKSTLLTKTEFMDAYRWLV